MFKKTSRFLLKTALCLTPISLFIPVSIRTVSLTVKDVTQLTPYSIISANKLTTKLTFWKWFISPISWLGSAASAAGSISAASLIVGLGTTLFLGLQIALLYKVVTLEDKREIANGDREKIEGEKEIEEEIEVKLEGKSHPKEGDKPGEKLTSKSTSKTVRS